MTCRIQNWIAGELRSSVSGDSEVFERMILDSQAGVQLCATEFPKSDFMDVVKSVQACNQALLLWSKRTHAERIDVVSQFLQLMKDDRAQILELLKLESGCSADDAEDEFNRSIHIGDGLLDQLKTPELGNTELVVHHGLGIVAVVLPMQNSAQMFVLNVLTAISQGNTVIIKSSSQTPQLILHLAMLTAKIAKLPVGSVNCVFGRGREVPTALAQHPTIAALSLAGQTESILPILNYTLESGKRVRTFSEAMSSLVVLESTQISTEQMTSIARSMVSTLSSGTQRLQRIFVAEKHLQEFSQQLFAAIEKSVSHSPNYFLGIGQGKRYQAAIQTASAQKSLSQHKIISNESAKGSVGVNLFLDLTNCSSLMQSEIPGPVVFLNSYRNLSEPIKAIAAAKIAHTCVLLGYDPATLVQLARKLAVKRVFTNRFELGLTKFEIVENINFFRHSTIVSS